MWQVWVAALAFVFSLTMLIFALSVRKRLQKMREEQKETRELDAKIFRLYNEIEEMLDSFEAYVGEVHDEMESRRSEMVAMSRQATTLYMQVMQPDAYPVRPPAKPEEPAREEAPRPPAGKAEKAEKAPPPKEEKSKLSPRDLVELGKLNSKGKKIRFLMGRGLNMSEIAREMKIGKGEIRLILDLDKE
ncbi:MAG: hypothetical protein LBR76_07345 [Oscillospiraceae bacterium]|jgi:hypothetical protein|nr:hypothetical protein [Oscillospiraceae bacterium]